MEEDFVQQSCAEEAESKQGDGVITTLTLCSFTIRSISDGMTAAKQDTATGEPLRKAGELVLASPCRETSTR